MSLTTKSKGIESSGVREVGEEKKKKKSKFKGKETPRVRWPGARQISIYWRQRRKEPRKENGR